MMSTQKIGKDYAIRGKAVFVVDGGGRITATGIGYITDKQNKNIKYLGGRGNGVV